MQAVITVDGELIVSAQSETEAFAIEQWYQRTEGGKFRLIRHDDGDEAQCSILILNTNQQIEEDDAEEARSQGVEE